MRADVRPCRSARGSSTAAARPDGLRDGRRARPRTSSGTSVHSCRSRVTLLIMLPPVRKGGMASSSSRRPHSAPIPDGPSILWPDRARKSTPSAVTSTGMCGTLCAASSTARRPASWASARDLGHRVDGAQRVADVADGDQLRSARQAACEVVEIEAAVIGDADVLEPWRRSRSPAAATGRGWRGAPSRWTGSGRRRRRSRAPSCRRRG